MHPAVWVAGLYGLVSLVGGVIGYVKAKSKASLIAGAVSGGLMLWAADGLRRENPAAELISLAIPFLLGFRFFTSWRKTKRIMPDFIMFTLGLATLTVVSFQVFTWIFP